MACPERQKYEQWVLENAEPVMKEIARHVADCPECQEYFLSEKDSIGLSMILASDEEVKGLLEGLRDDRNLDNPFER